MDRIAKLKDFISRFPDDMFSRHALAMELIKIGQNAESIGVMKTILAIDPTHTGTYYHLAKALEKEGLSKEAISVYEEGIRQAKLKNAKHEWRELLSAMELLKEEME